MKNFKKAFTFSMLLLVLFTVFGVRHLYQVDSKNLERVRILLELTNESCKEKGMYPTQSEFKVFLKKIDAINESEWQYTRLSDKTATLQYPMNLPMLWAPGKARVSEFLPIIYAFKIKEVCLREYLKVSDE